MTTAVSEQILNMIQPGQEALALEALDEAEGRQPDQEAPSDGSHPLDRYVDSVNAQAESGEEDPLAEFLSPAEEQPAGEKPTEDDIPEEYRGKSLKEVIALAEAKAKSQAQQAPAIPPEAYTPELGKSIYGETLTGLFAAAEVNPLQLDADLRSGADVSASVEALASKAGLPKGVIETYLAGVKAAEPVTKQLTAEDGVELRALVGGDQEFRRLSAWAVQNLSAAELAEYNAAVDGGDKAAVRWALRALQARAGGAPAAKGRSEPKLVSGGRQQGALRFTSQEQQDRAVDKRNSKGERLMLVDPVYAKRVTEAIANSPNFA